MSMSTRATPGNPFVPVAALYTRCVWAQILSQQSHPPRASWPCPDLATRSLGPGQRGVPREDPTLDRLDSLLAPLFDFVHSILPGFRWTYWQSEIADGLGAKCLAWGLPHHMGRAKIRQGVGILKGQNSPHADILYMCSSNLHHPKIIIINFIACCFYSPCGTLNIEGRSQPSILCIKCFPLIKWMDSNIQWGFFLWIALRTARDAQEGRAWEL